MCSNGFDEAAGSAGGGSWAAAGPAMADANKKRKMVRLLPSEKLVCRWIESAQKLPLKISY